MRLYFILLAIIVILPSAFAAVDFRIEPSTQTVQAGENFVVDIVLDSNETIWGFSFKLYEEPTSDIILVSAQPGTRIDGGLNAATEYVDRVTVFSAFAGSSAGIAPVTGTVYTLNYSVPSSLAQGTLQLDPQQLYVSDSNGESMPATISGASVEVEADEGYVGLWLPEVKTKVGQTVDVVLCATNTYSTKNLIGIEATISHNDAIAEAKNIKILQGSGTANIENGSITISTDGAGVQDADCEQNTGISIAKITYKGLSTGTTELGFSTVELSDDKGQIFSVQTTNKEGEIKVSSSGSGGSGSGGGGGGGSNIRTAKDVCRSCSGTIYQCCGATLDYVKYLCKRPSTYPNLCTSPQQAQPQQFFPQNFQSPPVDTSVNTKPNPTAPPVKAEEQPAPEAPKAIPQQQAPQLQQPQTAETEEIGFNKILGAVLLVLGLGVLMVFIFHKRPPHQASRENMQSPQSTRNTPTGASSDSVDIIRKKLDQSKKKK